MTKTIHVRRLRSRIDFAVITVRDDEFTAVLKRFTPRMPVIRGRQFYEYCRMQRPDGQIARVAVVRVFDQGQSAAQSVVRDIIEDLEPNWLVLTGIAGGIPDSEFTLGDVLLASSLHDLSVTAAIEGERPQFRTAGGPLHPRVERLLATLPAWQDRLGEWNHEEALGRAKPGLAVCANIDDKCYYGAVGIREAVRDSLQKHFPACHTARPPLFKIGACATSNVLLKDTALLAEWRKVARHLTHIEMEAGGAHFAARHSLAREVPLLCVRGISDIVGFRRDAEWTQFACESAASFLNAMVSYLPLEHFRDPSSLGRLQGGVSRVPFLARRLANVTVEMFRMLARSGLDFFTSPALDVPTLEAIVAAFTVSSSPLLNRIIDPTDRIPRAEQTTLENFLSGEDARVLCVLGGAGCGKTSLLALVTQHAIDSGAVAFGIKADILPKDMPFESWGRRELALDLTALDAIKAVASRSRVVVVVDQLDALASTVDLTSDRLNAVIAFIDECSALPSVSVICSCRTFDYYHDTRFNSLNADELELSLPPWEDVAVQLAKHGVGDTEAWPEAFREVLRTPQHLQVYLDRLSATGSTGAFGSYYLMLDDLWTRAVVNSVERDFLYDITDHLVKEEALWAPLVQFEDRADIVASLQSKQILQSENGRIGFQHQTLLEHAKARLFTKHDESLCHHVLERQDAVFVRPTIWAVLRYLREAHPDKYRVEIEALFDAALRLHVRYLLIEFLGEIANPKEFEIALLADRLLNDDDQLRVLISIQGSAAWFHALRSSHFPAVMRGPVEQQWPMIRILANAWSFARDECIQLIEEHWLSDPSKDSLTRNAMQTLERWDSRAAEVTIALVRRADADGDRLFWAEHLVALISANEPKLAPRVFVETVSQLATVSNKDPESAPGRWRGPLESTRSWYHLPAVAEAAPLEFLREGWNWLVQICEKYHSCRPSTVAYEYTGSCSALNEQSGRPDAPVLSAFCVAIDAVAETLPHEFLEITEASWSSANAVVHRLILRGLRLIARDDPQVGLRYLSGDRRRFRIGSRESHLQSDSLELVRTIAPQLAHDERQQLESGILSWSMYRSGTELSESQKESDREARLRLLASIPRELLTTETTSLVESEKEALPDWDREIPGTRSGRVRHIPPISKEEMLGATEEEVVAAITASSGKEGSNHHWVESEGGWEEAGGPHAAGLVLAEFAQEHPHRAIDLIKALLASGNEGAAEPAVSSLSGTSLTDNEVFDLVREIASLNPLSENLRSSLSYLLYGRCKAQTGLPDDLCRILDKWLSEPWDSSCGVLSSSDAEREADDCEPEGSVLWSSYDGILDTDQSFWSLVAITEGYLRRSPPETDLWLDAVEKHLHRDIAERTWAAYCSELRWIRLGGCDRQRGTGVLGGLFKRYPTLVHQQEGVRLIANVSDLLSASHLEVTLDSLRGSTAFASRQAYGELLTLIAFRDTNHTWAPARLDREIDALGDSATFEEPIGVGIAFAAAHLWDESQARVDASRVLCRLIPNATTKISQAISTVFWAQENFPADEGTRRLLESFAEHPQSLSGISALDLLEHLASLVPHMRAAVLRVCETLVKSTDQVTDLHEAGPHLVKIAMTLQRFPETRTEGLSLLEDLLRLGLDDAFRILRDIDIRPGPTQLREPRLRRRRRRP